MLTRRSLLASAALTVLLATGAQAQDPLKVVASFSILGDLVHQIGGEHVALTTLVPADGDAHVFQPTPNDAQSVAAAQLVFVNGLDFEGWMDRLIEASGYKGPIVVASQGVESIPFDGDEEEEGHGHAHGEHAEEGHGHAHDDHAEEGHDHHGVDPHAWQSVPNAEIYVKNIAAALEQADPANAAAYKANAEAYEAKLKALDAEIRSAVAAFPEDHRTVVTSHDAFGYFAKTYGLNFVAPEGISTESEASAQDVAKLIDQIRAEHIPAVFMENVTDPRLLEQIASETGAKIGGTVYSDALSGPEGPAATYIDMMKNNIAMFSAALK
ncbi:metal ABC transporter substrate-binding protein [Paenirhodobacter populi]|uniref:Metal ABC transporter substrate-binding protein n=1 Tax=Paenirhodobacter populi TaxID=2306993 RepID=A0A443ILJ0_9RHOB|nr:metal ABC transporter substrate-binding protein [Sinirhodobacter populi]RWR05807.1 metal ABC transporter substrate-binding protein [Sinirhodobacter populi]